MSPLFPENPFKGIPKMQIRYGAVAHMERGLLMAQLIMGVVHAPMTRHELLSHPQGKLKILEEAEAMRNLGVWNESEFWEVHEFKKHAREQQKTIHVAELMVLVWTAGTIAIEVAPVSLASPLGISFWHLVPIGRPRDNRHCGRTPSAASSDLWSSPFLFTSILQSLQTTAIVMFCTNLETANSFSCQWEATHGTLENSKIPNSRCPNCGPNYSMGPEYVPAFGLNLWDQMPSKYSSPMGHLGWVSSSLVCNFLLEFLLMCTGPRNHGHRFPQRFHPTLESSVFFDDVGGNWKKPNHPGFHEAVFKPLSVKV